MSEATRTREAFNAAKKDVCEPGLRDVWNRDIRRTIMAYTTHNTVNRLVRKELHLNPVVPE